MLIFSVFLIFIEIPYIKEGPFTEMIELKAGKYIIECWGAQGGNGYDDDHNKIYGTAQGGKGAYVYGKITLTETKTIYVNVGGQGESVKYKINPGGLNGGGKSQISSYKEFTSGGGGGATDIRIGDNNTKSRIIVAAGGSGAVGFADGAPGGDDAGRFYESIPECTGSLCKSILKRSGKTTQKDGSENGQGEDGILPTDSPILKYAASGGGGGWRGGYRGISQSEFANLHYTVAHSGSSFISGHSVCDTVCGMKFEEGKWTVGERQGNGMIRISFDIPCPDHCSICADSETCTECESSYTLYKGQCYNGCPDGTRPNNDVCEDCQEHCKKCSASKEECDACDDQTYLYNHKCSASCSSISDGESHFGINEDKRECTKCQDDHCTDCSSDFKICNECSSPFTLDEVSKKCIQPTGAFSPSSDFSDSDDFTKSSAFAQTNQFSDSDDFTKSSAFAQTSRFSESDDFTKSSAFAQTSRFSESDDFTKSSAFGQTSRFSDSDDFTKSSAFAQTNQFSDSDEFSESSAFAQKSQFSDSDEPSESPISNSNTEYVDSQSSTSFLAITRSSDFTSSSLFSKSSAFAPSDRFSSSDDFTKSAVFMQSNQFTSSFGFSKSSVFESNDKPMSSNTFSISSSFSQIIKPPSFKETMTSVITYTQDGSINQNGNKGKKNWIKSLWWVFLVAAFVIAAIIIIIVLIKRRKDKDESEENQSVDANKENETAGSTDIGNPLYEENPNTDDQFEIEYEEENI